MSLLGGIFDAAMDVGKTAWDIFAQNKTWDREDSAVQRRAADLKAAGLSPVLAAGSAAQTSGPISVNMPHPGQDVVGLMRGSAEVSQTRKQNDLTDLQIYNAELENTIKQTEADVASNIRRSNADGMTGTRRLALNKLARDQMATDVSEMEKENTFEELQRQKTAAELERRELEMLKKAGTRKSYPSGLLGQGQMGTDILAPTLGAIHERVKRLRGK